MSIFLVSGRRNYRYFFLFLFFLCIHMIFLFVFSLYYVLHERHHRLIPPNFPPPLPLKKPADFPPLYLNRTEFVGFSDYRFIICIVLLILLALMAIPIGGLTGFHIYLISQGRTTNEQVTGKYQIHNDVFNRGCWKNFCWTLCQPLYPKLKAPKRKRFDLEVFEQMAYGGNGNHSQTNGTLPNVQINPMDEKSRRTSCREVSFNTHHSFSLDRLHQNSNALVQKQVIYEFSDIF